MAQEFVKMTGLTEGQLAVNYPWTLGKGRLFFIILPSRKCYSEIIEAKTDGLSSNELQQSTQ